MPYMNWLLEIRHSSDYKCEKQIFKVSSIRPSGTLCKCKETDRQLKIWCVCVCVCVCVCACVFVCGDLKAPRPKTCGEELAERGYVPPNRRSKSGNKDILTDAGLPPPPHSALKIGVMGDILC